MSEALVRRSNKLSPSPTRRPRIRERRLITPEDSTYQNVVLLDTDEGAEVEFHLVVNSESLFILSGTFEVLLIDGVQTLQPGDLVYFPGNYSHGLRCSKGPGQFLAIFAPARGSRNSAWLETSYVEAWRQYVHEDRLSQTRNNLYLGVQAAFVALLTAAAGFLLPLDPVVIGAHQGFNWTRCFWFPGGRVRGFRVAPDSAVGKCDAEWYGLYSCSNSGNPGH